MMGNFADWISHSKEIFSATIWVKMSSNEELYPSKKLNMNFMCKFVFWFILLLPLNAELGKKGIKANLFCSIFISETQ